MQYRVTTVCDIIQDGDILDHEFYDEEYFSTREEAENYINRHQIGEVIGYHGDAEDVLIDIFLDEVE